MVTADEARRDNIYTKAGFFFCAFCRHSYSGQGEATFRSGNTYSGEFRRGVMDGRGRYTWVADGTVYEGDLR